MEGFISVFLNFHWDTIRAWRLSILLFSNFSFYFPFLGFGILTSNLKWASGMAMYIIWWWWPVQQLFKIFFLSLQKASIVSLFLIHSWWVLMLSSPFLIPLWSDDTNPSSYVTRLLLLLILLLLSIFFWKAWFCCYWSCTCSLQLHCLLVVYKAMTVYNSNMLRVHCWRAIWPKFELK